jgi:hypothetical protein
MSWRVSSQWSIQRPPLDVDAGGEEDERDGAGARGDVEASEYDISERPSAVDEKA